MSDALDLGIATSIDMGWMSADVRNDTDLEPLFALFEPMTGEYAIGFSDDSNGLLAELSGSDLGVIFASETDDPRDAIEQLEETFEDLARETDSDYETDEIGNALIGHLDSTFAGRFLSYGIDEREMFLATSDDLVEGAIVAGNGLADDPRFRATLNELPESSVVYLYFDIDEMRSWWTDLLGVVEESTDIYTERIEAVGLAVEALNDKGEINTQLFFLTDVPGR